MKTKTRRIIKATLYLCGVLVLAAAILVSIGSVKADPPPTYVYTKAFELGTSGDAVTNGMAVDASNNTYVVGDYTNTVTFDGPGGSDTQTTDNAHPATFITKRSADGTYLWTKTFDASAGFTETHGIAVSASGDLYVAGMFYNTVVFDGVGGSDSITSANQTAFVTKYNSDGTYGWTRTFDTSAGGAQAAGVGVDASGNVYFGGLFFGTVVFDGVGGTDSVTTVGQNAFVTKYSSSGTYAWTTHFDTSSTGSIQVHGLATDTNGNAYVTGYVSGDATFGGSDNVNTGNQASYVVKYATNGTYQYARTFDVDSLGGYSDSLAVATDSSGNIYFGGSFGGTVVFDGVGGSDTGTASSANCAYLTKYNSDGTYGWTKHVDDTNGQATVYGIAADTAGNVYSVGGFRGAIVFDGPGGSDTQSDQSNDVFDNAFISQHKAADGAYGWTSSFDSTNGIAGGQAVAVDSDNLLYMTGYAANTIVFDGPGGSDSRTFSNGFRTSFLTKYTTVPQSGGGSPGTDSDNDGISDAVEAAGPNGGDANNDGQADSSQSNVASFVNPMTSHYEVLATSISCSLTSTISVVPESSNATQDSGYTYPFGLTSFQLSCTAPGASTQFVLSMYDQTRDGLVVRKYYPATSAYTTLTTAVMSQQTIAGHSVVTASYQLTDGGSLDTDGVANGTIVDPAGLAVPVLGAPNTGLGGTAIVTR